MIIIDNLSPVLLLIGLGYLLKHRGITNHAFLTLSDRLVYYIFFPILLFWKIGGTPVPTDTFWAPCQAAVCALLTVFAVSTVSIVLFKVGRFQAGTYSQSCYRFNSYIGMAVVTNALGEPGVRQFSILIGVMIPLINVLSVFMLIWFSGKNLRTFERIGLIAKALVLNPLILACVSGMIYSRAFTGFPVFLDNTFRLSASVTLPLALLSIGGALTFESLRGYLSLSLLAAAIKLVLFPLAGYFFLQWYGVSGMSYRVTMLFFTMPTATSIYVLSAQLNSDTNLASATIVTSTILSFISLSVVMLIF